MRDAWLLIFQMYHVDAEPSWGDFLQRFGAYFQPLCQIEEKPLSVPALRETIRRMASNSACGPDGWRAGELKALPEAMLERLVVMLTVVASTGLWPEARAAFRLRAVADAG